MYTPNRLHVIGLTGGIACGKSTLRDALGTLPGVRTLDADKLGHLAYAPGTDTIQELVNYFGKAILSPDGTVDRTKLGPIVFADKSKLAKLNEIVWPSIRALALHEMKEAEGKCDIFILEAAVLVEAGWIDIVDEIWVVTTTEARERLMNRNKMSKLDADLRIAAQRDIEERRLRVAHVIISSDGPVENVRQRAETLYGDLKRRLCTLTGNGSERVAIVSPNGNSPIDVRKRSVVRAFNLPHRATYVAIFHVPSGKYVVQQRTNTKEYMPGMFDPCPGGVVDAWESYAENARRETFEEMGIDKVLFEPTGDFWFESSSIRCWGRIFLCRVENEFKKGFVLQASEVQDILLMTPEEILLTNRHRMTPDGLAAFETLILSSSKY